MEKKIPIYYKTWLSSGFSTNAMYALLLALSKARCPSRSLHSPCECSALTPVACSSLVTLATPVTASRPCLSVSTANELHSSDVTKTETMSSNEADMKNNETTMKQSNHFLLIADTLYWYRLVPDQPHLFHKDRLAVVPTCS